MMSPLGDPEREAIARLWARKLDQDARGLPRGLRHRNLEPASAEFLFSLAIDLRATRLLEIGGSSGISTIALAVAARETSGRLISIEIEPERQAEAKLTIAALGLAEVVEFRLGDAADILPGTEPVALALLDCEKEDYVCFFNLLPLRPRAVVVADNILSHDLSVYVAHVRAIAGATSRTVAVGKGLEVTRLP